MGSTESDRLPSRHAATPAVRSVPSSPPPADDAPRLSIDGKAFTRIAVDTPASRALAERRDPWSASRYPTPSFPDALAVRTALTSPSPRRWRGLAGRCTRRSTTMPASTTTFASSPKCIPHRRPRVDMSTTFSWGHSLGALRAACPVPRPVRSASTWRSARRSVELQGGARARAAFAARSGAARSRRPWSRRRAGVDAGDGPAAIRRDDARDERGLPHVYTCARLGAASPRSRAGPRRERCASRDDHNTCRRLRARGIRFTIGAARIAGVRHPDASPSAPRLQRSPHRSAACTAGHLQIDRHLDRLTSIPRVSIAHASASRADRGHAGAARRCASTCPSARPREPLSSAVFRNFNDAALASPCRAVPAATSSSRRALQRASLPSAASATWPPSLRTRSLLSRGARAGRSAVPRVAPYDSLVGPARARMRYARVQGAVRRRLDVSAELVARAMAGRRAPVVAPRGVFAGRQRALCERSCSGSPSTWPAAGSTRSAPLPAAFRKTCASPPLGGPLRPRCWRR